jgi:heme exporter protein B
MDLLNPMLFALLVCLMFPIGLGPAPQTLAKLAPGLIWVIVLLSSLLSTDKLFKSDYADGTLALWLLSPRSHYFLVLLKVFAYWLSSGLMLLIMSPILVILLNLPLHALPALMLSLLAGSISLVFIGAIGSALTVGLRQSSVLLSLIILPLYVPVLILGVASVQTAAQGMPVGAYIALLLALAALTLTLSPLAIMAGLKINLDAS